LAESDAHRGLKGAATRWLWQAGYASIARALTARRLGGLTSVRRVEPAISGDDEPPKAAAG